MSARTKIFGSASLVALSLGLIPALAPAAAQAQAAPAADSYTTLGEVIVTAERRVGNAQKTGAAITVRSGDDLLESGKFSLGSILENVPGVTGGAASGTAGTLGAGTDSPASGLVIRGIPSNIGAGGSTSSTAAAAAIYVDGVYNGIGGGYDLDRVEVLRGPQGTLYGRSATSGVVAIHTRDPNLTDLGAEATVEAGNYGLRHYTGVVNVPIVTDKLAVRISGNRYQRNGFLDAEGGAFSSDDAKVKILYKPNDTVSLLVGAAMQDNVTHSGGYGIGTSPDPKVAVFTTVNVGSVETKLRQYWAELNVDLGFATLTYQPAFRSYTQDGVLYGDTPLGILGQPVTTPKDEFVTHELRLSSNADSKLIWQVGALYYNNQLQSTNQSYFGGVLAFDVQEARETTAYGVFAQATYPVTDTLRVTAGARYDTSEVAATSRFQLGPFLTGPGPSPPPFLLSGKAGERDFSNFTYKLRVEKDLTPTNLLYGSVSTGFSPGDVVVSAGCPASISATPPCALELEAETLTSYEIGSKNRFLGDTLQLNGAVFYSKYGAFQAASINVNAGPGAPEFAPLSSPLTSYGVELEAHYKITPTDMLDVNFSWTKSRYVNKPAIFAQFVAEDEVTDNGLPGAVAPIPIQASVAYQHDFILPGDSKLSLRGEALYLSGHGGHVTAVQKAAGREPLLDIDSAVLGNVSATWTANENVSVSGYVRNVFDKQYFNKIILDASGPVVVFQQRYNDPRTYGVVLNVKF